MSRVLLVAVALAWFVVMLGAYTRLTNAGLGCPDWPGCYGHWVLPHAKDALADAQANYPGVPIAERKAWTEMAHRYVAGCLGLVILWLAGYRLLNHRRWTTSVPLVLVLVVVCQAVLGMWTVTLKLLPLVVTLHLLGGLTILSCLWWCYLSMNQSLQRQPLPSALHNVLVAVTVLVCLQIALGGWVSTNYAGVSCIGFPTCNGQWLPNLSVSKAFHVMSPIGENYEGGRLDSVARITIQYIHRIGALITALMVFYLAIQLWRTAYACYRRLAVALALVLVLQFSLGVINVLALLPLPIAVAHNGTAALLLMTLLAAIYLGQRDPHASHFRACPV